MANIIKHVDDYIVELQKDFPDVSQKDLLRIMTYGLRQFANINMMRADICLDGWGNKCWASWYSSDPAKIKRLYSTNSAKKSRYKYKQDNDVWDGYYYASLGRNQFAELDQKKLKKGETLEFKNLYLFKIPEECWLKREGRYYFFRFKYPVDCGFAMIKEKYKTKDYEYLGNEWEKKRNKWVFEGFKSWP